MMFPKGSIAPRRRGIRLWALAGAMTIGVVVFGACQSSEPIAETTTSSTSSSPTTSPDESPTTLADVETTTTQTPTDPVADFYSGETITMVVGFSAGGGYDLYTRTIAAHFGKHVPGEPNVIVENQPEGGGMAALNELYTVAPQDGTVVANVIGNLVTQQLFDNPSVEFDASELKYIGAPNQDTLVLLLSDEVGVTSFAQITGPDGTDVVLGSPPPGTLGHDLAVALAESFDANITVIPGYDTAQSILATEQGEIDGFITGVDQMLARAADQLDSGEFRFVVTFSDSPHPAAPDVETIMELAETDAQRQLMQFLAIAPTKFGRPYILGPDVPQERVDALESAFADTMNDPDFQAEIESAGLRLLPLSGEELEALILDYLDMPEDIRAQIQRLTQSE